MSNIFILSDIFFTSQEIFSVKVFWSFSLYENPFDEHHNVSEETGNEEFLIARNEPNIAYAYGVITEALDMYLEG